jgi:hypothetical protein
MNETAVTAAVAAIAERDPAFRAGVLQALVTLAAERGGPSAKHAAALKRRLPRGAVQMSHQYYMEHKARPGELLKDFLLDKPAPWSSFLDWVWFTKSFALAVEVKTSKRPRFQAGQLDKYHRAFKYDSSLRTPYQGLLLLTTVEPRPDELVKARRRRDIFIGAVLWKDAGTHLRPVIPAIESDAVLWTALLDELVS